MDNTRKCGAPGCERPATRELSDTATASEDQAVLLEDAVGPLIRLPDGASWMHKVRVCDEHEMADVPGAGFQGQRLEQWWASLTDDDRGQLLPLQEGNPLPTDLVTPALTRALGVGPVGTAFQGQHYTFHVDRRLADFLAEQRAR